MDQQNRTVWTAERLIEILRKLAEEQVLPKHLVDASVSGLDTVETLGIDSIGAVEFIDQLEVEVGVMLPDDFLDFGDSIDGIAHRLNALNSEVTNG